MLVWNSSARHEDLFSLALGWLREDRDLRRVKEKEAGRVRGPKKDVTVLVIFDVVADDFLPDNGCQDVLRKVRLRTLSPNGGEGLWRRLDAILGWSTGLIFNCIATIP